MSERMETLIYRPAIKVIYCLAQQLAGRSRFQLSSGMVVIRNAGASWNF